MRVRGRGWLLGDAGSSKKMIGSVQLLLKLLHLVFGRPTRPGIVSSGEAAVGASVLLPWASVFTCTPSDAAGGANTRQLLQGRLPSHLIFFSLQLSQAMAAFAMGLFLRRDSEPESCSDCCPVAWSRSILRAYGLVGRLIAHELSVRARARFRA